MASAKVDKAGVESYINKVCNAAQMTACTINCLAPPIKAFVLKDETRFKIQQDAKDELVSSVLLITTPAAYLPL